MAGSIANLNVRLTANIGAFAASMSAAAKPLASFAGKVGAASAKVVSLAGAATALVAGGSLVLLASHSMEAIDANAKLADRLGYTTEQLVGLQHAAALAGVNSEELTGALEKMLKNIAEAAQGGGTASDTFRQLGLDVKTLANSTPDEAFKAISDGLMTIENPAQRAAAMMDIFGKSGQSLGALLMSGSEGIAAAQAEAEKLGLTFNRVDAAKVEAANDSITRMKAVFTGVTNQIAIGLSPFIDAAAKKFTELATSGGGIGPKVGAAIEWVTVGIAKVSDYLNLARAGFKYLQAGATYAVFGIVKAIDYIGQKFVDLLNLLPGVNLQWTTFTAELANDLLDTAHKLSDEAGAAFDSFSRGDNANAAKQFFDDIRAKSQAAAEAAVAAAPKMTGAFNDIEDNSKSLKKVADTLADIQKELDQFGLTDSQKKLDDLRALGATEEQLAQAEDSLSRLDALNAAKKKGEDMDQRAKSVIDATRTPLEKYDSKIGELSDLLNAGAIDWDTYGRAVRDARKELEDSSKATVPQAPDLFIAGSAEAQKFIFQQTSGIQRLTKDDLPKAQLDEAKDANRLLDRIDRNTRKAASDLEITDIGVV